MNKSRIGACLLGVLGLACALATAPAQAQWPERTIRLLHGFTPGGNVDLTARAAAQILSEGLGQAVVVEGRPGAGGTVAANVVAKAEPDGYTLFMMASGHSISPGLYRALPYDSVNDFTMVSLVSSFPFLIAVGSNSPIKSLAELVRMAKEKEGAVALAHAGIGTGMHLSAGLLQSRAGIRFNEIAYKGGNAAPLAAAQGEVAAVFDTPAGMESLLQGGRLRALAVTSAQRWPGLPDVPTVAESVMPGYEVRGWLALAGPKNLPRPVVARLAQVLHKGLARPDIAERFRRMGTGVAMSEPEDAQKFLAAEVVRWLKVVQDAKIPPQD